MADGGVLYSGIVRQAGHFCKKQKMFGFGVDIYIDDLYIIYVDRRYNNAPDNGRTKKGGIFMPVEKSLISGSTSMLLLRLLEEKDMYGYEMIETLESRSNHVFSLKAGTLYPLLHLLEEKNYLHSYESDVKGKTRKYYRITKDGIRYLKTRKEEWQEYAQAVSNVLSVAAD